MNYSLQDAKLDPEVIDEEPIYPDIEDYCFDLSDSLNLTQSGESIDKLFLNKVNRICRKEF